MTDADLRPTKSRLALLAAIDRGEVRHWPELSGVHEAWDCWKQLGGCDLKVDARIREMIAAGWIEQTGPEDGRRSLGYRPTDTGRAVLDQHTRHDGGVISEEVRP